VADHGPLVDAARQQEQVVAVRAQPPLETRGVEAGQLADRGHAQAGEHLLHRRADTPEASHGQRREHRRLGAGLDDHEPVGLAQVGGDLRHQLRRSHAHRSGEADALADRLLQRAGDLVTLSERAAAAGDVEEGFVDRDRLHAVGEPPEHLHDLAGDAGVLLHVGRHVDSVRAQAPGLRDGHRAADAEAPGLVRRGGDDAASAPASRIGAHDHGPAAEVGMVALLDGRVERVHVDVEDRPRR
jgi:hypothetical protein